VCVFEKERFETLEQHVVVAVILGYQCYARPLGAVFSREVANKVFGAESVRPNHLDGHAQRVAQQKHFHLEDDKMRIKITLITEMQVK